ncbi:1,4-dihydroxy-2-naphthoate polyprenyltransferase [Chitinophagales bacterium]|nr:1,4-dihydroxy-2-naphthoate polyprenyltransferase [Chitinophagales bacterium]
MSNKAAAWLSAFRLRTLPLAIATIAMGSHLAFLDGQFSWPIAGLTILTAVLLQLLSNLANDYGDGIKGTDNENRLGPIRAIQSGILSVNELRNSMIVFSILSLASGCTLLYVVFGATVNLQFVAFFLVGLASIAAAIKYTAGKNPYGYSALGDLSVFLFFGLVAVVGTYYLQTGQFSGLALLPAMGMGLLSTGVLNTNNMRDIDNDLESGKITVAGKLGKSSSKTYHFILIIGAMLCFLVYASLRFASAVQWLFVLAFIPLIIHLLGVKKEHGRALDPELKKLVLSTLLLSLLWVIPSFFGG